VFFSLFDSLLTCTFLLQVHKIQLITPNIGVAYRWASGVREWPNHVCKGFSDLNGLLLISWLFGTWYVESHIASLYSWD
jgi:hypothetical protein